MIELILDWMMPEVELFMVGIGHIDSQKYLSRGVNAEQGENAKKEYSNRK